MSDISWESYDGVFKVGEHPLMYQPKNAGNHLKLRTHIVKKWREDRLLCIGGESGDLGVLTYIDFNKLIEVLKTELTKQ